MSVIEVHQEAGVALVRLNRPDAHNALNRALSEAIIWTFADLAVDEWVRAIVLTGAGRAFCAGVDLKALTDEPELLADSASGQNRRLWWRWSSVRNRLSVRSMGLL